MRKKNWHLPALVAVLLVAIVVAVLQPRRGGPVAAGFPAHVAVQSSASTSLTETPIDVHDVTYARIQHPEALVEVCGLGKVSIDTDPAAFTDRMIGKPLGEWLSTMLDSGDVRTRAAGLLLEPKLALSTPPKPMSAQNLDSLVQIAVGAQDPAVYAMAVHECYPVDGEPPHGSCDQVSVTTWASMDSKNAVPWLMLASQARSAHDAAAENAAIAHAVNATKTDSYLWSLLADAEPALPADATPLQRYMLSTLLISIEAGMVAPSFVSKRCSREAVADQTVRTQCDVLATLMVTQGTTLLDFMIGTGIGSRIGWPADKVAQLREKADAMMQVMTPATGAGTENQWTCDTTNRGNAFFSDMERRGELGAIQEILDRSGETIAELARDHSEKFHDMVRKAQKVAD